MKNDESINSFLAFCILVIGACLFILATVRIQKVMRHESIQTLTEEEDATAK